MPLELKLVHCSFQNMPLIFLEKLNVGSLSKFRRKFKPWQSTNFSFEGVKRSLMNEVLLLRDVLASEPLCSVWLSYVTNCKQFCTKWTSFLIGWIPKYTSPLVEAFAIPLQTFHRPLKAFMNVIEEVIHNIWIKRIVYFKDANGNGNAKIQTNQQRCLNYLIRCFIQVEMYYQLNAHMK